MVSPDGKRLFVLGGAEGNPEGGSGLVALMLDPTSGDLTYDGCVGWGGPGCTEAIDRAGTPVLSPDGKHLLLISGGQRHDHGEITVYPIVDGHLKPAARCYAHPAEEKPCEPLTVNLDGIPYVDFSPDGSTLAVRTKGHLALLGFDATAGTLALDGGCLRERAGCRPATDCRYNTDDEFVCERPPSALAGIGPVAFATDGRAIYVASHESNLMTAFPRVAERTWALDGPCVGRADTDCGVKADLVDEALELLVSPDGGDVYVSGYGNGITALQADRVTGALTAPRCSMGDLGVGSCDRASVERNGAYSLSRGNLVMDATGRDLYTPVTLGGGNRYGIGHFLRITRPPGGANRPPACASADATTLPGGSVETQPRCVDPDGDAVSVRITRAPARGYAELSGGRLRFTAGIEAGDETVGFRGSDGGLESAEAVLRVVVGQRPACTDAQISVEAGSGVTVPLQCDRGELEVVERPLYGALGAWSAGSRSADFRASERDGTEVVRFVARDAGTGISSDVATVTITVRPRPAPPAVIEFGRARLENDRGGSGCSGSSCRPNANGELPFPMRCNGNPTQTPGSCSGTLEACSPTGCKASTGRPTIARVKGSLGRVSFKIAVGKSKTVKLRLNRAARRELSKRGKLTIRIRTDVRLPDGSRQQSTRKLTLKRPAKKSGGSGGRQPPGGKSGREG
jgi:hypothetical protein